MHLVVGREDVPDALFSERLNLKAAGTCVALSRRPERASDLCNALLLMCLGDQPGFGGEIYQM
ncbi:MAG: DUF1403 family protein [Rhodobacterales bacterium]|uniref:DUF1403 family protein n=1 Tax=Puniceibacterium antarcticum TaxID=1206336 RepID=UPI003CCBC35A